MPNASLGDILREWEKLLANVAANAEELSHLETFRSQLVVELQGAKQASERQSSLKAQVQQTTRDLEGCLVRGKELAVRLRNGVRSFYGLRGEKLTEFGLQPLRRRARPKPQETVPPKTASTVQE